MIQVARSALYDFTPTELQKLLDTSNGYSDLLRSIGMNPKGGNPATLKRIINEYNLDTRQLDINRSNYFKELAHAAHSKITYDLDDILNGKHPKYNSYKLLKRLVSSGYKEYKCEICGISEWNNKPISLQLHHIDGNHTNHRLDNLQILCPNCHSQTDTFAGKKSKNNTEPKKQLQKSKQITLPPVTREELKQKIRTMPFVQIAKEFGVTDNAIRKWCDKYKLPRKVSVIKEISEVDWELI